MLRKLDYFFGRRLAESTKTPQLKTALPIAAIGRVSTAPEFRGAPPPRAIDLLQELKPDFQEIGVPLRRPH